VRIEFKKNWDIPVLIQVLHTISAFANDFLNLNGGYIIIGIEERNGLPVLPPEGIEKHNIDEIQKQIRGQCRRLDPEYQPLISPEIYEGKQILIIWVPGGDVRPYQAPKKIDGKERAYYVRLGSQTVEAKGNILTELMQMTARIPFDDRRNTSASIDIIAPTLVRHFLANIKSRLVERGTNISDKDLYRSLRLCERINDHEVLKNIALLFFLHEPEQFFPYSRIEIVQFIDDAGGDLIGEQYFNGPLDFQIKQALNHLKTFCFTKIRKIKNQAEHEKIVTYPFDAIEEALINAIYHKSYEVNEPVKVYIYPGRMEIISYPGPVPGIMGKHFRPPFSIPPVQNRNRRIGEFLKDLKMAEGRGTGIPKILRSMSQNASPKPVFDFDDGRTYFRVILYKHLDWIINS